MSHTTKLISCLLTIRHFRYQINDRQTFGVYKTIVFKNESDIKLNADFFVLVYKTNVGKIQPDIKFNAVAKTIINKKNDIKHQPQ